MKGCWDEKKEGCVKTVYAVLICLEDGQKIDVIKWTKIQGTAEIQKFPGLA